MAKFCKYLPEFGVTPVLIVPEWTCFTRWPKCDEKDGCEVIRVQDDACGRDEALPPRLRRTLFPFRDYEDMQYASLEKKMLKKALEICKERHFDAIFASSIPQYIHRIAYKLHKKTGIKWIADYRDLVDQEQFLAKGRLKPVHELTNKIYRRNYIARDIRYANTASHVITVSEGLRQKLEKRNLKPDISVIMNGYDPEDYAGAEREVRNEKLTIRYTGSTYGNRRVDCLGKGYSLAVKKCPELAEHIVFEFYGTSCRSIEKMAGPYSELKSVISLGGSLPHSEIVKKQCSADVLYLISHKAKGIVTGKIFEYLAAGKRIVSIPGDGDATDSILRESGIGTVAGTPEEVCDFLCTAYDEWRQNGRLSIHPNDECILQYSRREGAKKLAEIITKECSL